MIEIQVIGKPSNRGILFLLLVLMISTAAGWLHGEEKMSLTLHSKVFGHNDEIPSAYTCQGEDRSPPLEWEGIPHNTQSLVLIIDDPDAPDPKAPKMTWVHWIVYNLPATVEELPEGLSHSDLPQGAQEGLNNWDRTRYGGPCPPIGRHRYFFKLYALDTKLLLEKPTRMELLAAMKEHVIEKAELIGMYQKK